VTGAGAAAFLDQSADYLNESGGYAPADFVPFSAQVYFRLIERVGETFWPLHVPAVALGLAVMILAWRGRSRIACALLAVPWAWTGITFLGQRYAELNWAGGWFAGAFLIEAGVLLSLAATGAGFDRANARRTAFRPRSVPHHGGLLLAGFGVLVYPMIAPLSGFDPLQAEAFGIHPDPTAVAALGILLMALRGLSLWLAAFIPLLWCLVTGLTLAVLDAAWAVVPPTAAILAVALALWKTLRGAGHSPA
jgi:hypothetical protein